MLSWFPPWQIAFQGSCIINLFCEEDDEEDTEAGIHDRVQEEAVKHAKMGKSIGLLARRNWVYD